jgi:hypothetical protein
MNLGTPLDHSNESDQTAQLEKIRLRQSVRTSLEEQYENWKKSSFLERPMMRKEFTTYTGITVEEMVSTLMKLEDSLQGQEPVAGFVEPLRKLAAYRREGRTTRDRQRNSLVMATVVRTTQSCWRV